MSIKRATTISTSLVAALLACGCVTARPSSPAGDGVVPGAADGFGGEAAAVVTCNDGALVIAPSEERAGDLVATVADQGVVDWFVAQSQLTSVEVVEYSGTTAEVTVEHAFPWMVSIEERDEGRALVIRDLRPAADGYATSGPGGVTIRAEGEGLRLAIGGSRMPSSHSVVYYEVGQWYFEDCGGEGEEPVEPTEPVEGSYFGDDTRNTALGYEVTENADAEACELYVDSLAELSVYQYHHAGYRALLIDVATRGDLDVLDVGMFVRMDEVVTNGDEVLVDEAGREVVFTFSRREGELYRGLLQTSVDRTDGAEARRRIERFAFFVDVAEGDGAVRRVWLKAASTADFSAEDIDRGRYYYSTSEPFAWGEGTSSASYLWRDSGSPVFAARETCL